MANLHDALQDVVKMYDESVKEADDKGYAELFKKTTEEIISQITSEGFTIENLEYLDGYFIFGSGTNSVVHFNIKECPEWLWGIWYDAETLDTGIKVSYQIFNQREPVDKFKPSRATYIVEGCTWWSNDDESSYFSLDELMKMIKFIKKHPIRAWACDYYFYDYRYEVHSGIELLAKFCWCKFKDWKEKTLTSILDKSMLKYTKKLFLPTIEVKVNEEGWEPELVDRGEYTWPRYEYMIKIPNDSTEDTGCYGMFDDSEDGKKLTKSFNNHDNKLRNLAKFFGVYWSAPIDDCIIIYKEKGNSDEKDL